MQLDSDFVYDSDLNGLEIETKQFANGYHTGASDGPGITVFEDGSVT